ncbi:MAG: hypothetical protein NC930_02095 [Candidatus Omnitrophica bacterium]|nr:hypothetical protein [Candidatus Omnitrophota bacterium]
MQKIALKVAGYIFLAVALIHLMRFIVDFEIVIADFEIPLLGSGIAAFILFSLAVWLIWLSNKNQETKGN